MNVQRVWTNIKFIVRIRIHIGNVDAVMDLASLIMIGLIKLYVINKMTLTDQEISKKVRAPLTYFRGLKTLKDVETRYMKMKKKTYTKFSTDKGVKTRTSSYTKRFREKYPNAKSLPEIAKATKIPLKTLRTVYDRGLAAWRTGHRPGASPQAWAYARVHSFVMKGKTYYTADKDLALRLSRPRAI